MAGYYGTGYSQGVGQQLTPAQPSYQAGIPMAGGQNQGGFYAPQSAPTSDSAASATASGADKIQTPAIGSLLKPGYGGAISESSNLANTPSWASQYINGLAGQGASSGQMNDAYYQGAPTLGNIYNQYGSGFDPSKFTGLSGTDGSLSSLQSNLGKAGYGLDNIGGYYQNQSMGGSPVAGVNYNFDPTFGLRGSIGGLDFDVGRLPFNNMSDQSQPGSDNQASWLAGQWAPYVPGITTGQIQKAYGGLDQNSVRGFQQAGSGFQFNNAQSGVINPAMNSGRATNAPSSMYSQPTGGRGGFYGY